jgi:NADH-quinone oxidoreductase subunit N
MNALFVLCGIGIISLLSEIVNLRKGLSLIIVAGLAFAILLLTRDWNAGLRYYNDMVVLDNFSIAFSVLITLTGILWFSISRSYFQELSYKTDRSALVIFALIGAFLMVSFNNFAMLFLGIEILSISLYVLAGSRKRSYFSNEASFKYFLMGSFATGFFLFGVALLYGATGSFDLTRVSAIIGERSADLPAFFHVGVLLILVGMAFKMSAAPFHFWAPDVYEGSPTIITAFMSTVVKVASVGAFFKVFVISFSAVNGSWISVVQILMVLTLIVGNLSAVYQINVKRILAYSSIGHIGFILLAMIATPSSQGIIFYYLAAYCIASIAAFGVVVLLEKEGVSANVQTFQGLFKRNSLLGVVMTVSLLSLAGIPPLAGFFAKYLVFGAAIESGYVGFVILGVVTSLIGVYYYFGIIKAIFSGTPTDAEIEISLPQRILFFGFLVLILALGLFPDPVISLLKG